GKVLTADNEDPANFKIVQAVAIYDGKFVVVGSDEEALQTAGPGTRRVDLQGRTGLPGLIESHLHVHSQAASHYLKHSVDTTDPPVSWTTKEEGLAQLRTLALKRKPGEWIVTGVRAKGMIYGAGWKDAPTIAELDAALPNNPVSLMIGGGG